MYEQIISTTLISATSFIGNMISNPFYNIMVISSIIIMIFASISDLKKREVADMINYGFFFFAIALRLIYATIEWDYMVLVDGLIGFIVASAIGTGMFYAGQWGGGDAKMLISLGVIIGLDVTRPLIHILLNLPLISFIINMLFAGSIIGLIWSAVIAFRNWKKFLNNWEKLSKSMYKYKIYAASIAILITVTVFLLAKEFTFFAAILSFSGLAMIYVYIFAKSVEKGSMVLMLPPEKVTEGDWIDQDVKYKGKIICGPKDLGITKQQIAKLKKYDIKKIPVKIGIPFIPSFLVGFLITITSGNIITVILKMMIV